MLATALLSTAALGLMAVTKGIGCVSNNGPAPNVYDIVCNLPDPQQPTKPALRASAQGTSFIIEKNNVGKRYSTEEAFGYFGCDVNKTEMAPLIAQNKVAQGKIFFYHELHAYWEPPTLSPDGHPIEPKGGSDPGIVAIFFVADYSIDGEDKRPTGKWVNALGFCNYWPAANTSSPNWQCTCESKHP